MTLASEPERYPFHDNDACPEGQEVKRRGDWQYDEPHQTTDTRSRCFTCIALHHREK